MGFEAYIHIYIYITPGGLQKSSASFYGDQFQSQQADSKCKAKKAKKHKKGFEAEAEELDERQKHDIGLDILPGLAWMLTRV